MTGQVSAVLALACSAGLATVLALLAWRRPSGPGSVAFALTMLAVAAWEASSLGEFVATATVAKITWAKLDYLGIVTVPPAWLMCTWAFAMPSRPMRPVVSRLLWVVPVVTVIMALTNDYHHLMWSRITPSAPSPTAYLIYTHGPYFWFWVAYSYLLFIAGSVLLLRALLRSSHIYRRQASALLTGMALPWLGNVLYVTGRSPVAGIDPTPFTFTLCGLLWFWALYRLRLFDLVPVARETLVESMDDGLLVIDALGRVVDINPAAAHLVGTFPIAALGAPLASLLPGWAGPGEQGAPTHPILLELQPPGSAVRTLDVRTTALRTTTGRRHGGYLVVLRDVTASKAIEDQLHAVNESLRAQLEQNAVLHEEAIRDPLTGLFNRRYLHETLARELAHVTRSGVPVSLVVLDIDHFKLLNDTYGHDAGDDMLRALATMLSSITRGSDMACRYGGEEFVMVLPEAGLEATLGRVEQWRQAFAALRVRHGSVEMTSSFSAGVAVAPFHGTDAVALFQAADSALYAAKSGGRNRVVAAPLDEPFLP